jgi:ATP-dependent Clp protease ATP-binding subunit ClpB
MTEAVRRKPYSVVLFDEVEKAHPDVFNTLLQILDDGRLTDAQGRTVDFRNTVVIMTSNIGSLYLLDGLNDKGEISEQARDAVLAELRGHFRPEFLNRVDETVLFKPLTLAEIERVVDLQIEALGARLHDRNIELQLTEDACALIAREGYDPVYGARPLRRFIQRELETRVGRAMIADAIGEGAVVTVSVTNGELDVRWTEGQRGGGRRPEQRAERAANDRDGRDGARGGVKNGEDEAKPSEPAEPKVAA